jgi:glycosyltransferase involved in cell wall biosynthesis
MIEVKRHALSQGSNFLGAPVFYLQRLLFGGHSDQGVLLVTRGDLFPADHGAAVKIIETARGLSRQGLPVALVTDDRRYWWRVENGELIRKRMPLWIRLLSAPEMVTKALHYSKDIPANNAFLYLPLSDSSFFWRTLYAGRKVGARIIQAEFPAYVRPGVHASRILDTRLVLVEHNVEYERIRSQVKELTEDQYQRYRAIEIDLCNQCDAVICVSDNDRQQLAMDGVDLGRLYTVPHGVDLEQFALPAEQGLRERFAIPEDAPLLVYHGTFSYPPNQQALGVFATELLPRLERLGLNCHVLAVGREPPAASPHPRIHLTGSVETVGPWIKAADLAVVPLLDGGGTRMKIIDCFAARTPVISTAKGIEGIPVISGKHALIIDDWDEMAAAIQRLIENPTAAETLAAEAHRLAAAMDWKSIAASYLDIFDTL